MSQRLGMLAPLSMKPTAQAFFDPMTATVSYIVFDGPGSECVIIDLVLDFDAKSGRTATTSAEKIVAFVRARKLQVQWLLETHAHADHLSASYYLQEKLGGKIAIGQDIRTVQGVFQRVFNLEV